MNTKLILLLPEFQGWVCSLPKVSCYFCFGEDSWGLSNSPNLLPYLDHRPLHSTAVGWRSCMRRAAHGPVISPQWTTPTDQSARYEGVVNLNPFSFPAMRSLKELEWVDVCWGEGLEYTGSFLCPREKLPEVALQVPGITNSKVNYIACVCSANLSGPISSWKWIRSVSMTSAVVLYTIHTHIIVWLSRLQYAWFVQSLM